MPRKQTPTSLYLHLAYLLLALLCNTGNGSRAQTTNKTEQLLQCIYRPTAFCARLGHVYFTFTSSKYVPTTLLTHMHRRSHITLNVDDFSRLAIYFHSRKSDGNLFTRNLYVCLSMSVSAAVKLKHYKSEIIQPDTAQLNRCHLLFFFMSAPKKYFICIFG